MVAPDVGVLLWPATESASRGERQPLLVCVCVFFNLTLTKRALQRMTKIVLSPSQRPPDLLKEQSVTCLDNLNCCPFFSQDGLLFTTVQTHTRAHTRKATFYSLYITLSSFKCFLFTFMTQYSTVTHCVTARRLRVPVPWGARAFSVWTLHVSVWFLPNCCP